LKQREIVRRAAGIEPATSPRPRGALPLNYARKKKSLFRPCSISQCTKMKPKDLIRFDLRLEKLSGSPWGRLVQQERESNLRPGARKQQVNKGSYWAVDEEDGVE
jgi:hypothetical protein